MRLRFKMLLVFVALLRPMQVVSEEPSKPRNVVLIVMDAVGAQHLNLPEAPRPYVPNIARLAKQGVSFKNAYSVAPWTMPSVASILTGVLPSKHEVTTTRSKLHQSSRTLAEVLMDRNYATLAVTSHTFLDERHGFSQGFEQFHQVNDSGKTHSAITSQIVSAKASSWLEERATKAEQKNFFMMLHFFDPHFNFRHHADFDLTKELLGKTKLKPGMSLSALEKHKNSFTKMDLAYLKLLLAEELAYTDHHIGLVIRTLEKLGVLKDTLVIITADHGEGFMEHGSLGHTVNLFDELLHVPLVISGAGVPKGMVVNEAVTTLDIFPTIVQLLNVPEETKHLDGISLFPKVGERNPDRILLAEVGYRGHDNKVMINKAAARMGPFKMIINRNSGRRVLFNTSTDPEERRDILQETARSKPELLTSLARALSTLVAPGATPANPEVDFKNKEIEQLKTLGYF